MSRAVQGWFCYRFGVILGSSWGHFSFISAPGAPLGCPWGPESGLEWLEGVLGGPLGVLGRPWGASGGSMGRPWGVLVCTLGVP